MRAGQAPDLVEQHFFRAGMRGRQFSGADNPFSRDAFPSHHAVCADETVEKGINLRSLVTIAGVQDMQSRLHHIAAPNFQSFRRADQLKFKAAVGIVYS